MPRPCILERYFGWLTFLLLAILGLTQLFSVIGDSQTADEAVHLSAGYSYLRTADFRMNPEHPPLGKLLAALPLLFFNLDFPAADVSWRNADEYPFGNLFLYNNRVSADTILLAGRLVTILLTLLMGVELARRAKQYFGPAPSLFALLLFTFDPNIIAHGRYVTTDMIATLFIFVACCNWADFLCQRRFRSLAFAGAGFGAAQLSKYSAVVLIPIFGAMYLFRWWQESKSDGAPGPRQRKLSWRHLGLSFAAVAAITLVMTWVAYGFEVSKISSDPSVAKFFTGASLSRVPGSLGGWIGHLPANTLPFIGNRIPIPMYSFWKGFFKVLVTHHESYLLGKWYPSGSLLYFPIVVAVKTPVATLALLALTSFLLVLSFLKNSRSGLSLVQCIPFELAAMLIPALIFFAFSVLSRVNIGARHILPVLPFLFILIGVVLWRFDVPAYRFPVRVASLILALLLVVESAFIYPHYLSFFNFVSGGPENGPRYLIDSNIDWGQDLKRLGDYVARENIGNLCLSYFGWAPPAHYGIHYRTIDSIDVTEQREALSCVVAVSVNSLYSPQFSGLRKMKPDKKIGYSIYIYKPKASH